MATPIKAQEAIAPAINLKPKTKILSSQGTFHSIYFERDINIFGKVRIYSLLVIFNTKLSDLTMVNN